MPRTTDILVKGVIEVDVDIPLTPFIEVSNELVTEVCVPFTNGDGSAYYSATRLELIERWLAAHFYAIRDPRLSHESAGSVSASYQNRVDLGLDQTTYGQQAKLLDTKGGLASLDISTKKGRRTIGVYWLGSTDEELSNL